MKNSPYEMALRRRDRFKGWASLGMFLGLGAVVYVSMHLHGVQGMALGMAYSAAVGWCVWRERCLDKEADAILAKLIEVNRASNPR